MQFQCFSFLAVSDILRIPNVDSANCRRVNLHFKRAEYFKIPPKYTRIVWKSVRQPKQDERVNSNCRNTSPSKLKLASIVNDQPFEINCWLGSGLSSRDLIFFYSAEPVLPKISPVKNYNIVSGIKSGLKCVPGTGPLNLGLKIWSTYLVKTWPVLP